MVSTIHIIKTLPANKVANHVGMTHHQRVRVFLLARLSSMEMLPESSLDACTILEELLQHIIEY